MTIQELYERHCQQNPPEVIIERIRTFLDAVAITTVEDAEAEIASWGYADITNSPDLDTKGAFRVYRDDENNLYICTTEQEVIALANCDEEGQ